MKMRVGLFTDTYYPQVNGVATSILTLKDQLERLGHQVFVFTTTDGKVLEREEGVYRVPSVPIVCEKRLALIYHPRLMKVIKGLGLDVIHTHTEFSLGIFGRMMARELEIPHLHTYHTIYEDYTHYIVKFRSLNPLAKSVARKMSASFCNSANRVIVPTKKVAHLLESYGVTEKMEVIPTGIQLDRFDPKQYSQEAIQQLRTQWGISPSDRIILFVGRIAKEKNIEELLESLASYLPLNSKDKFVIVGDGPQLGALKIKARALGIQESVRFVGEVPWSQIGLCYQTAELFVSASQSETQGITYIEALAAGLPVVAKADPCLEGVVVSGVNGYTFDEEVAFLTALKESLGNKELAERALASGAQFSAQEFASKIEGLYEDEIRKHEKTVFSAMSV